MVSIHSEVARQRPRCIDARCLAGDVLCTPPKAKVGLVLALQAVSRFKEAPSARGHAKERRSSDLIVLDVFVAVPDQRGE